MDRVAIIQEITAFIQCECQTLEGIDTIHPDAELIDSRILDSLMLVKLMAFLEETFDISVQAEDVSEKNVKSISVIATFVQNRRQEIRALPAIC